LSDGYESFLTRAREVHHLAAAAGLLAWDQETYLPPRGVGARAKHKAALAAVIHDKMCAAELGDLIDEIAAGELTPEARANLRELKRERDRAVKIPRTLVTELAEASSLAQQAWVEARRNDDWPRFTPHLARLIELKRQEAHAVGFTGEPYNALLDEYEPGGRIEDLLPLFAELEKVLVQLIGKITASSRQPDAGLLRQRFPVPDQDAFGRELLQDIGFDFDAGRLDVSAHPFTEGLSCRDVRITTRYEENNLGTGLFASLHEGGHALYEQGLPPELEGTPVAVAVSVGIHESQSRLWENCVGRSREFCRYYLPRLQEIFPVQLGSATAEQLYQAVNVVTPSLIRIEADEVTYNLHILLRLELERGLLAREIEVDDLPGLWRRKMRDLFGLEVSSDADGVLQDIHWAFGVFGYFPTYTLGNLYAAQFFAQAAAELGDLPGQIAGGEFGTLLGWLREKIHLQGSLQPAEDLCRQVTGHGLSSQPFLDYLEGKFADIYEF